MKLINLVDALEDCLNFHPDTTFWIVESYDDTTRYKGQAQDFDRVNMLSREVDAWGYSKETDTVKVYLK